MRCFASASSSLTSSQASSPSVRSGDFSRRKRSPESFRVARARPGSARVSRLREILFAEDAARKAGSWDPDGDGVGSALFLGELTAQDGMRGAARLAPPLLERYPKLESTSLGPARRSRRVLVRRLPSDSDRWLERRPERGPGRRARRASLRRLRVAERSRAGTRARLLHRRARAHPLRACAAWTPHRKAAPSGCDDALAGATQKDWRAWRGKKPRKDLPGDAR